MPQTDVLIAGGGVSGILAAIAAARAGNHPIVLEKLDHPGKKLLATGNGRCNLMNLNPPVYYGDSEFADSVLGENPVEELTSFWHELGLILRYDSEGRGYPCTFQAATVLNALKAEITRLGVSVLTGKAIKSVQKIPKKPFMIQTCSGESFFANRLILSTGGAAQPKLGGNQDAWPWLQQFGHTMVPASPALTPLISDSKSVSGLSGIRVRCRITVLTGKQVTFQEEGEVLFTSSGISGICAMQCARFISPGHSECLLHLTPDLFPHRSDLLSELRFRRHAFPEETPVELLRGLCVPKLSFAVCKQAGLSLRGEKNKELDEEQLEKIASVLQGYRIPILGVEGFDRAQVMAGGLNCEEVSPQNMESILCPGLHITGELMNVDGDCGGYNLMFACMSGLRAGWNGRKKQIG